MSVAGISIEVSGAGSAAALGIDDQLRPFLGQLTDPVAQVALRWEATRRALAPVGQLIYDPGSIWKMYATDGGYLAAINYRDGGDAAEPQAVLRTNADWDDVTLTEQRSGLAWRSLLGLGAGELILRSKMVLTDGLMLHAAGVDDNGRGIVFVGHAGAGKSTQAALWSGVTGAIAMSDDRVAVRAGASRASCYGTPWGGTANIARNHHAPLSAIVVLEQAPENEIRALAPSMAAPLLLARAFLPYWDGTLMQRALANLNSLLAAVPVYRLRCRPERAAVSLARSVL